jgi:uncharacterized membrane protein
LGEYSINFEATDLASLVWLAVVALAALRAGIYVARGRRPGSALQRGLIVAGVAGVLAVLLLGGRIRPAQWSHGWWCLLLAALTLPWLVRSYRETTRPVTRRLRALLVGLRLAAGAVVLLMLARPVLEHKLERRERATVGILIDTSQSMDVRDVVAGDPGDTSSQKSISRRDVVRQTLDACSNSVKQLESQMNVEWMAFDSNLRRTQGPEPTARGRLTALHRNVDAARQALIQTGAKIAGVIVISDGRDTAGGDAGQAGDELAMAGIPLFCVGVGNEIPAGQTRSLQARRLEMPDHVSVLNKLEIEAEFLAAGLAGTPIDVRLDYDGKPVGTTQITSSQMRELVRAELTHVPTEAGLHQVTVVATVAGLTGRQSEAKLSQYVRVTEDRLAVLYIDRGRYERAAIVRALEYAKELSVTKVDLSSPSSDQAKGPAPRLTGESLPQTPEQWGLYRVVIIGDVDRSSLPDEAMQAMADLVGRQGRGIAMLGGVRTLGSGQYRGTPLDGLLPADLGVVGQTEGPVAFVLTPAGKTHPCCRVADSNESAWKKLPPFAGASRLGNPGPTAEVLVRAESGEPLLVVRQQAAGRSAVVAFDSTWRWAFSIDEGLDMQRRFWRQLVLWLANRQPEVWVLADRPQYDLMRLKEGDERVTVRAGVSDPNATGSTEPVEPSTKASKGKSPVTQAGKSSTAQSVTGEVIGPDGQARPLSFKPVGDGFEANPVVTQLGEYRVRVQGTADGQPAGRAETAFVVEQVDRELLDPLADLETLKRMAARTASVGGMFMPIGDLGALLERIRASGMETRITLVQRDYLVDDRAWMWLVAFVALLTLEWIVRRAAGLV